MVKTPWQNRLLTNSQPHIHYTVYIMPNGDVRPSHSAGLFQVLGRTEEEMNEQLKRLGEEDNSFPDIFVETAFVEFAFNCYFGRRI